MKAKPNMLVKIARLSMIVARRHLAAYSCAKSKHVFTQPQLMTCLVLKTYLRQDYRGIVDVLEASAPLQEAMGLSRIPNFSTLKKFSDRCCAPDLIDAMLGTILAELGPRADEPVAIDSTGMDPRIASLHFRDKTGRKNSGYVKVSVIVTCISLLAVTMTITWGPRNDLAEAPTLLARAYGRIDPPTLYGDKGYDAEWLHRWCQERWLVRSVIPPVIRSKDGSIQTPYRRKMLPLAKDSGRRWSVESFFSGLKRTCGDRLSARTRPTQFTEAAMRVLAYTLRR